MKGFIMPNNQTKCFTSIKGSLITPEQLNARLPSQCVVDLGYEDGKFIIEVYTNPGAMTIKIRTGTITIDGKKVHVRESGSWGTTASEAWLTGNKD